MKAVVVYHTHLDLKESKFSNEHSTNIGGCEPAVSHKESSTEESSARMGRASDFICIV